MSEKDMREQPFERFPDLAAHMGRMAWTGQIGTMLEWCAFAHALNASLQEVERRTIERCAKVEQALESLLAAKALKSVRKLVAGWNGEERPEGPFSGRHPARLGARIETNCGGIYELDDLMRAAASAIRALQDAPSDDTPPAKEGV